MKNFLKKCLSLMLVVVLAVGIVGPYLPGASTEVEATETTETPKYMAKMVNSSDATNRTAQRITVTPGTTYVISYKMYVITKGNLQARAAGEDNTWVIQGNDAVKEGYYEKSKEYTVPDGTTSLLFNFQVGSGEFYLWDISFTAEGSDVNLLENADFSEGNGSLIGWMITGYNGGSAQNITTVAKSHELESATGRKVILYNEDLFSQDIENREQIELSGDPEYMAKVVYGKRIEQYVSVPATVGDTYILNFSYYKITTSNVQLRVGYRDKGDTSGYFTAYNDTTSSGECKTASIEYSIKEGEDELVVRMEGLGASANSYIWGISLTKKNGDGTNLLSNANFSNGGGSWIGWNVSGYGDIKTVSKSEEAETATNCQIVSYNPNLFSTTNTDIALWSVQPILEESLDLNYKTTLTSAPDAAPTMSFVMTNGEETVKESTVTGTEIGTNKYSFSCVVLPQHMANTITATLTVTVGGVESTETKTYSVKQYCGTLLSYEDESAYLKNLVADLMRYGAQTQAAFGKADTITTGLTSFMSGYGSNAALANAEYLATLITGDNANATYKWKSASLVLDGKVTIRLKFTTEDVSALKVKVNDEAYDIKTADGYYYVDIPMAAISFDDTVTANFYEGEATDATGATLSYSVNTYLYRKRNGGEKDLLESIYKYGQSAEVYNEYIVNGTISTLDNEISDDWSL